MTGAPVEAGAEKGMPVRIRSSPATVSGAQAIMLLTQVGKALRAMKLSPGDLPVTKLGAYGR